MAEGCPLSPLAIARMRTGGVGRDFWLVWGPSRASASALCLGEAQELGMLVAATSGARTSIVSTGGTGV